MESVWRADRAGSFEVGGNGREEQVYDRGVRKLRPIRVGALSGGLAGRSKLLGNRFEMDTRNVYDIVDLVYNVCCMMESNTSVKQLIQYVILVCHCSL